MLQATEPAPVASLPVGTFGVKVTLNPLEPDNVAAGRLGVGRSISNVAEYIDIPDHLRLVCLLDGFIVDSELWPTTFPEAEQHLELVAVPGWEGALFLAELIGFSGIGASLAAAVIFTVGSYAISVGMNAIFGAGAPSGNFSLSRRSGSSAASRQSPSLTGTRNEELQYRPIWSPYGRYRTFPPLGAHSHTEVIGETMYLKCLFNLGYGPMDISTLKIGDTPIEDFEDVVVEIREGYPGDTPITLYPSDVEEESVNYTLEHEGGGFVSTQPSVLYKPPGDPFTCEPKWFQRRSASVIDEFQIDVLFPAGFRNFDNAGDTHACNATFEVDMRDVAEDEPVFLALDDDSENNNWTVIEGSADISTDEVCHTNGVGALAVDVTGAGAIGIERDFTDDIGLQDFEGKQLLIDVYLREPISGGGPGRNIFTSRCHGLRFRFFDDVGGSAEYVFGYQTGAIGKNNSAVRVEGAAGVGLQVPREIGDGAAPIWWSTITLDFGAVSGDTNGVGAMGAGWGWFNQSENLGIPVVNDFKLRPSVAGFGKPIAFLADDTTARQDPDFGIAGQPQNLRRKKIKSMQVQFNSFRGGPVMPDPVNPANGFGGTGPPFQASSGRIFNMCNIRLVDRDNVGWRSAATGSTLDQRASDLGEQQFLQNVQNDYPTGILGPEQDTDVTGIPFSLFQLQVQTLQDNAFRSGVVFQSAVIGGSAQITETIGGPINEPEVSELDGDNSTTLSHVLPAGERRAVIAWECHFAFDRTQTATVTAMSYGGIAMTRECGINTQHAVTGVMGSSIWFLPEVDLPADGSTNTLTPTWTGTSGDLTVQMGVFTETGLALDNDNPFMVSGQDEAFDPPPFTGPQVPLDQATLTRKVIVLAQSLWPPFLVNSEGPREMALGSSLLGLFSGVWVDPNFQDVTGLTLPFEDQGNFVTTIYDPPYPDNVPIAGITDAAPGTHCVITTDGPHGLSDGQTFAILVQEDLSGGAAWTRMIGSAFGPESIAPPIPVGSSALPVQALRGDLLGNDPSTKFRGFLTLNNGLTAALGNPTIFEGQVVNPVNGSWQSGGAVGRSRACTSHMDPPMQAWQCKRYQFISSNPQGEAVWASVCGWFDVLQSIPGWMGSSLADCDSPTSGQGGNCSQQQGITMSNMSAAMVKAFGEEQGLASAYEFRMRRVFDFHEGDAGPIDPDLRAVITSYRTLRNEAPTNISGCAFVALKIKANDQLSGVIDSFNCIVERRLTVYDPTNPNADEDGLVFEVKTRNPAWAFLDVLIGPGNARPASIDEIDLLRLKEWADYCDELGRSYDSIHDSSETVLESLQRIALSARASFHMREGKFSVVIDRSRDEVRQVLSPRNCEELTGTKDFSDLPDGLKVQYLDDSDDLFQRKEVQVLDDGRSTMGELPQGAVSMPFKDTASDWFGGAVSPFVGAAVADSTDAPPVTGSTGSMKITTATSSFGWTTRLLPNAVAGEGGTGIDLSGLDLSVWIKTPSNSGEFTQSIVWLRFYSGPEVYTSGSPPTFTAQPTGPGQGFFAASTDAAINPLVMDTWSEFKFNFSTDISGTQRNWDPTDVRYMSIVTNLGNPFAGAETYVANLGLISTIATDFDVIELSGITSREQAYREGRYRLASNRMRKQRLIVGMDWEYLVSERGDRVQVSYDTALIGIGGARIITITLDTGLVESVTLDAAPDVSSLVNPGIRIRYVDASTEQLTSAEYVGTYAGAVFTFNPSVSNPGFEVGSLAVVGDLNQVTDDYQITDITPDGRGAKVRLEPYAEQVYKAENFDAPPEDA